MAASPPRRAVRALNESSTCAPAWCRSAYSVDHASSRRGGDAHEVGAPAWKRGVELQAVGAELGGALRRGVVCELSRFL